MLEWEQGSEGAGRDKMVQGWLTSRKIPISVLARWCRSLSHLLDAGVPLLRALQVSGEKATSAGLRTMSEDVGKAIRNGATLGDAMRAQSDFLPDVMVDMIDVAEQTGNLPEVLDALAVHYEHLVSLRKQFLSAITWPVIQGVAAIFIIAGLILVLGIIAESTGSTTFDVLGLGLRGGMGAAAWLLGWIMAVTAAYVLWQVVSRTNLRSWMDGVILGLPVLGPCARAFALARFSWAFALTQNAGMHIVPSIDCSLKATGNKAFEQASPRAIGAVKTGHELAESLAETRLFPAEYIETISVSEAAGTVPETLQRLSPRFEEEAQRRLGFLTTAAGWAVWALIALFIVVLIFRVFSLYVGMLNEAAKF